MENQDALECAECESERAKVVCCTESLAYCNPCSLKIHSKRARSHHTVLPIPPCSRCLLRPAKLQCFQCSKSNHNLSSKANPIVLCTHCSTSIHHSTSTPVHNVTVLAILSSIIKIENQFPSHVKQEKLDSEDECLIKKGKKRKSTASYDSNPDNKCSSSNKLRRSIKEETQIKEEPVSPREGQKGPRRNTPRAATKRVFGPTETDSSSSESESDGGWSDFEEETGVRRMHRGSVSVEAFVVNAEDDDDDGGGDGGGSNARNGEQHSTVVGIKERIRKMLELGLHPDTPDIEAQQALKNAQRLLTKHNLQQVEVMEGALKDSSALAGGMRVVELRYKGRIGRLGRIEEWVIDLVHVIADNFDTQYFTRKYDRQDRPLQVVFYGIKQNADCSGYAFAATFNRITIMSANYYPSKSLVDKDNKERALQRTYTRIARNNYKLGIVAGLKKIVSGREDAADSEEYQDKNGIKGETKGKGRSQRMQDEDKERERKAIQALVLHSKEVGQAYIKAKGIKIKTSKARMRETAWNIEAFTQGEIDSKQIDINQKALPTSQKGKSSKRQ